MQDEEHKNNPKSIIPVPTTKQSYQRLYAKEKQQKVWIWKSNKQKVYIIYDIRVFSLR